MSGSSILFVVYDNQSMLTQPPHGIAYLVAACQAAGISVDVWDAAVTHAPPKALAAYVDRTKPAVVGIGVIGGWWQYRQLRLLADALKSCKHKHRLILGGHGPAPVPEYFMRITGADTVFVGEADVSLPQWYLGDCEPGIVQSIPPVDIDSSPRPAWEAFDMSVYLRTPYPRKRSTEFSATVLSGRGCPYECSFCFRLEKGFRPRAPEAIADEVRWLQRDYGVTYVNFDDELLTASAPRTVAVCEALMPLGIRWMCNGRVNVLAGERGVEVLDVMKRAGCVFVNLGIESLDDNVLEQMNKRQRAEQSIRAVERCLAAGVSPGLNVLWGAPGDSAKSLRDIVQFLLRYDDHAQCRTVRPVTPYPGTALFARAVAEGKIRDVADFYERAHVNSDLASVQWTGLPDYAFHGYLASANKMLVQEYHAREAKRKCEQLDALYMRTNDEFRGFRQT